MVTPTALDFGAVTTEAVATREITIANPKGTAFDLTTTLEGPDFAVQVDRAQLAQGLVRLTVTFAPRAAGEITGTLRIRSAGRPEIVVALRGLGLARELRVEPNRLAFGAVPAGGSSTQSVVVTNDSAQALELYVVRERDVDDCRLPGAAPFCVTNVSRPLATGDTVRIEAREAMTFDVTFTARAGASAPTGVLGFARCASCPPVRVALEARVLPPGALTCTPVDLDVGALDIGLCSSGLVYCANDGTETRRVLAARLAAGSSPAFGAPSTPLPAEVIPRGAVALDVAYCPRAFGADVGTLEIETDDPDPSLRLQRVALRGRGGVARLRVEPSPLEFGEVAVGAPARRRVWLINDGFVPVTVAEIRSTSDGADVDVSPRSLQVAPGHRAAVWVTLTARAAGRVEGQLEIQSDDSTLANLVTAVGATAVDLPPCAALVGPTELDFGEVEQGRSLGRALEIENLGAADCLITSVELESADGTFRLLEPLTTSRRLAPGRVTTVPIDVWPTAAQGFAGRVTVGLSSSVAPLVEIPLRAAGAQGLPLLSPTELDFGAAPLGCMTMERTATLYNDGVLPLTVTSLGLEPPDRGVFTVATSVPLPATLPPGTSLTITGTFRLTGPSAYATAARLVATRGGQPYSLVLPLSARVDAAGVSVERPTQREPPMLDILYVMDNSCGMGGVNRVVSSAVEAFMAEATTAQADYQLGVVTMDLDTPRAGQLEPVMGPSAQRVTPAQVDPAAALRALITGANSEEGSAAEQGLGAFVRALSAPLAYGWNLGLLRPEAELAVIVVSDEDDSSRGSTDYYLDALRALKGSRTPHRVQLSAVVGDAGAGCMGPVSAAAAGTRYIELARRSGGSFHSICTADWARTLGELGLATFGPKVTFALRGAPQPATLSVSVDGAMVRSTAWSYDAQTRAITFAPTAVPPAGAQLEVSYQAVCR